MSGLCVKVVTGGVKQGVNEGKRGDTAAEHCGASGTA